jgi:hypothetical protein
MPYIPASRLETPHRFIPYPEGHAVSGACVRCGMSKEQGHHGNVRVGRRAFAAMLSRPVWAIFLNGWKN